MAEDKKVKKSKKSEKSEKSDEVGSATPPAEAKSSGETPSAEAASQEIAEVKPESVPSEPETAPAPAPVIEPEPAAPAPEPESAKQTINSNNSDFQRLEEKAKKAEEAHAAEVKVRKELEALNAKLLAEKTALLDSLSGEKGALQDYQERCAKLQAQKNDLENQLRVSICTWTKIANEMWKSVKQNSMPMHKTICSDYARLIKFQ